MNSTAGRRWGVAGVLSGLLLAGCSAVEDVVTAPTLPAPTPTAVLQGTVTGLGTRRPVVLQNNGDEQGARSFLGTQGQPNVAFSFGSLPTGTPFDIRVQTQPFGKICTVANGRGVVGAATAPITVIAGVMMRLPLTVWNSTVETAMA